MLELANEFGLNCSIELRDAARFLSSKSLLFQWKNPPEAEVADNSARTYRNFDDADLNKDYKFAPI